MRVWVGIFFVVIAFVAIVVIMGEFSRDRKATTAADVVDGQALSMTTSNVNTGKIPVATGSSDRKVIETTETEFGDGDTFSIAWYLPNPDFVPPVGPAEANYGRLKSEAEAGDGVSAFVLAKMMGFCGQTYVDQIQFDEAIDRVQQTHLIIDLNTKQEFQIADPENLSDYVESMKEDFAYCEGITSDQRSESPRWLEMSANSGYPLGMIEYGKQSTDPQKSAILFESAWNAGNGEALRFLSESYAEVYEQGIDPTADVLAYAAMYAYVKLLESARESKGNAGGWPGENQVALDEMSSMLLPREIAEAVSIAKEMVRSNGNCCSLM